MHPRESPGASSSTMTPSGTSALQSIHLNSFKGLVHQPRGRLLVLTWGGLRCPQGLQAWSCLKDFRFSCISSSSRFAGRGVLPDSCPPVPHHLQGIPELRGTGPKSVTSLCFCSIPGFPRCCCMAAGVDALFPCETSYTCAWEVGGGDM